MTSPEILGQMLPCLKEGRDQATKEANRFLIFGLAFTLLYIAKIVGYDLDELFLGRNISEIRNGSFIFLVISQSAITLYMVRSSDAAALEKSMEEVLGNNILDNQKHITEVYPNAREWLSPTSIKIKRSSQKGVWRTFFNLTSFFTVLIAFLFFAMPVIAGLCYIGNPLKLYPTLSPDFELTVVFLSTVLCAFWIVNGIAVSMLLSHNGGRSKQANGDHV